MNSQRLSLSSSVFAGRIKKFDTYQHDSRTSQRVPVRQKVNVQNQKLKPVNKIRSTQPSPTIVVNSKTHRTISPNLTIINHPNTSSVPMYEESDSVVNTQKIALMAVAKAKNYQPENSVIENQFVKNSKKFWFSKMSKAQYAFYGFGMIVFLFAGFVSIQTMLTNNEAKEQIGVLGDKTFVTDSEGVVESTDGSEPAEEEVSAQAIANYRVDPELPRYLRIPEIGVNSRIKHTGVNSKGAVDAPKNINDVSWFNESAKPGNEIGSSLLLGHVSGWSAPGVFKKIDKLQPGTRIEIEKGSGQKLVYEVTKGEKIPLDQVDMSKILSTETVGQHDLKLMTCSGRYNKETKQYEDRYLIYAKILK
ncbi:MAG: class F sortase [Candidatus Saccharibacteria bacterium]|nr:class F sortase [Candidatus Saccharibacteria bacterium]